MVAVILNLYLVHQTLGISPIFWPEEQEAPAVLTLQRI